MGRLSTRCWNIAAGTCFHSSTRALVRSGTDVGRLGLARSRRSSSSQRCSMGLRSGLCAGQSSSSTPILTNRNCEGNGTSVPSGSDQSLHPNEGIAFIHLWPAGPPTSAEAQFPLSPVKTVRCSGTPMVEQAPSQRQDSGVTHHLPETLETPPL
ncbi:hypothetical protein J4Q44_G00360250 [Coregonus suidteri]|uniref:Uncharacterized protein n=1 Tax=Coregonus suidteri TaxID=861788 RepID=A0AAN8KQG8_9TELE